MMGIPRPCGGGGRCSLPYKLSLLYRCLYLAHVRVSGEATLLDRPCKFGIASGIDYICGKDSVMSDIEKIQLYEDQKVRTIWIESEEKWYFSIKDVVLVLADAKDPKDYLSKMRRREPELAKGWGQIVHPLVVRTPGGPQKENPPMSRRHGARKKHRERRCFFRAQSGNRTRTILLSQDFESSASTNSAIRACGTANVAQNRRIAKFFSYLCSL